MSQLTTVIGTIALLGSALVGGISTQSRPMRSEVSV
jgi:hypothetical protein